MKPKYLLTACLAVAAIAAATWLACGNRVIQAHFSSISVTGHDKPGTPQAGAAMFQLAEQIRAFEQYSLCFRYNTTGLARPEVRLADAGDGALSAHSIQVELPRNSFGLGDVCLKITPHLDYTHPILAFSERGNSDSSTRIHEWTLSGSTPAISRFFDHPILATSTAEVYLENNFLRAKFMLPLVWFVTLWLGSGLVISSCISGLNRLEIALLAPVTGLTFIAFLGYALSLIGIYSAVSFTLFSVLAILAVLRKKSALGQPLWPARTHTLTSGWGTPRNVGYGRVFDFIAALLIVYMLFKYISVAATPFFGTWDGLVSWNKWGTDWATREARGNYQFTYPQMIPVFYSAYYRLAGYSADDPLGLSMNGAHFFITYIGLLALPLIYACSKALRISPIIPVALVLLDGSFFDAINRGYVDNALVTYNLACVLLILRVKAVEERQQNLLSLIAICLVGAGAMFLKQTGVFATVAVLAFVLAHYRQWLPYRTMLLWSALMLLVPAEFYLHELILDYYPSLVEDNPLNHSIGGVWSNAAAQHALLPDSLTWYGMLTAKMLTLAKLHLPVEIAHAKPTLILAALFIVSLFGAILVGLHRARQWRHALIWGTIVGGQLLIAARFGRPAFGDSEELRYIMTLLPALALVGGLLVGRIASWWRDRQYFRFLEISGLSVLVMYTVVAMAAFEPGDPVAKPGNGFDTVSFDERLARFYSQDNVKLNEFLVAQQDQSFRLFTESDFVVRPNTIYDGPSKSTPTKMARIYRSGDYWYSSQARTCPLGFEKLPVDVSGHAFCRKR